MPRDIISISVVIRTKDSAATFDDVISGLGLDTGDEVIVVDSGSQDATLDLARAAGAKIVDLSHLHFSYSGSLNSGFREARNDWVLSLSSHCVPAEPNLLEKYRRVLSSLPPEVGAITGRAVAGARELSPEPPPATCTQADFLKGAYFTCGNPNCLYRRSAWAEHPFDETVETAEDLEWSLWALNQGYQLMRLPAAAAFYRSHLGLRATFRKGFMEARAARRLVANPPFPPAAIVRETIRAALSVPLQRTPVRQAIRRLCYFLGDFWGRRAK